MADTTAAAGPAATAAKRTRGAPAARKATPARTKAPAARAKGSAPRVPLASPDPAAYDSDPARYIARVDRRTHKEIPGPIEPDELLVHAHRDHHPFQVTA